MKWIVTIYENISFKLIQSFSSRFIFDKSSVQGRWLIKKIQLFWVKLCLTTTIKREKRGPVWDKPVLDLQLCFCPILLWFCWLSLVAFGEFIFQKFVTNPPFGWEFCVVQHDTFILTKTTNKLISTKKSRLHTIGRSIRGGKVTTFLQLAQKGNLSTRIWQNSLFIQHSQTHYVVMQKEIEILEFVQGVDLEFLDLFEKQRYKIPVIVWRLMWRNLQFRSICRYCYCWQISWIEYYLH